MKKNLLLPFLLLFFYPAFSQSLYSNTDYTGNTFNPGLGASGTPRIVFDDVPILSSLVQGTDSISVTKVVFGLARFANAPAVTLKFYYTIPDDTATTYNNFIKLPPVQIGSVDLPANGPNTIAVPIELGDSITSLFKVKTDTGNLFRGYQTLFIGFSVSNNTDPAHPTSWLLTIPGAPESDNADVFWVYDQDRPVPRYATSFAGANPPVASFYLEVYGKGLGTLPVTLVDFNAKRSGKANILSWRTQQELNTRAFVVERSNDGRNYTSIGQVAASGNSGVVRNYSFTDNKPATGVNYYRLRITDKDNSSKLSLVRSIRNTAFADINIFPNPVKDKLTISINSDKATAGYLTITDLGGKSVYANTVRLSAGNTVLPVKLDNMAGGTYILKMQLDDDVIVKKFNKQ